MGWRGVLRSANAASRASARNRQRLDNAERRAYAKVNQVVGRLDQEVERDLERMAKFEGQLAIKPITAGGLRFREPNQWSFKELSDNTGQLKWAIQAHFKPDAAALGEPVEDQGRVYRLKAIAVTQWGFFRAFTVSEGPNTRGRTKLFNKTNPLSNRVLLVADGKAYRALEGQLDAPLVSPEGEIALVAFPLPPQTTELSISFLFKAGIKSIALSLENVAVLSEVLNSQSLVEQLRQAMSEKTMPMYQQASETRAEINRQLERNRGCMGVFAAIGVLVALAIAAGRWIAL